MISIFKKLTLCFAFLHAVSCANGPQDKAFQQLLDQYQMEQYNLNPMFGNTADTLAVKHLPIIPNKNFLQKEQALCKKYQKALSVFEASRLSAENQMGLQSLTQQFAECLINQEGDSPWLWDASRYDIGPAIQSALQQNGGQVDQMAVLIQCFVQAPAFYEAAKQNLQMPDVNKLQLAVRFNRASFFYLKNEASQQLLKTGLTKEELRDLQVKLHYCLLAIKDYIAFCNSLLFEYGEPESDVGFRGE